jgi:hypothetical protein
VSLPGVLNSDKGISDGASACPAWFAPGTVMRWMLLVLAAAQRLLGVLRHSGRLAG